LSGSSAADAIDKALDWSALGDRAGDVTRTLSGGMKRRLNIAAGTLHKPDLLLLDEPTVGVDPQSREKIYSMIEQLRTEGVSILYTTHYMEEAERLCDRISIVDQGVVIAEGTRDELVRSTLGEAREISVACDAPIDLDAREIASHELLVDGNTVRFTAEQTGPKLARVLGLLGEKNSRVVEVRTDQRSLEEVFLQLTGRGLRE